MIEEHMKLSKNCKCPRRCYATAMLLDYPYFQKYYKLIAMDLNKQQKLDADPKAIQQINFTGNIIKENTTILFIIEEAKETVLNNTVKVLRLYFALT